MLKLNVEQMPPEALLEYHKYLLSICFDPMTSADREAYRKERSRVALRLAFPRQR